MQVDFISFLAGAGSTVLVWILKEISQWKQYRKEDRKVRNNILFNLLELLHLTRRLDTKEIEPAVLNVLYRKFPELKEMPDTVTEIQALLGPSLHTYLMKEMQEEVSQLASTFEHALIEYSKVDPLQAHRLRGKSDFIDKLESATTQMGEELPVDRASIMEISERMQQMVTPKVIEEIIESLIVEITEITAKIGRKTKSAVKRSIEKNSVIDESNFKNFEIFIEKVIVNEMPIS